MNALGVWGEAVEAAKRGETLGDAQSVRLYAMGQSQASRDRQDGRRDARRVIAGKLPLRGLNESVTAAYREGWEEVALCLG